MYLLLLALLALIQTIYVTGWGIRHGRNVAPYYVNTATGVLAFVAGVGLLRRRAWAYGAAVAYFATALILILISAARLSDAALFVKFYWNLLLLILLALPGNRAALRGDGAQA